MNETTVTNEIKKSQCPKCGATIPVYKEYVSWCECGWGLEPQKPDHPLNLFESLYVQAGRRLSKNLFDKLIAAPTLKPTWNVAKVIATALATLVHATTLIFVLIGIVLIARGLPNLCIAFWGVVILFLAWVLRPQRAKLKEEIASREKHRALYQVADRISSKLDASPVDGIVFGNYYNAGFSEIGWRRKKILFLGLPFFSVLDAQERIYLIAHEIAHSVNGDSIRSFFVGSAIDSLLTWYSMLRPEVILDLSINSLVGLVMVPLRLTLLGIAQIPRWTAFSLINLLWRDSQRAEYLADLLATQVSGKAAALTAMEKGAMEEKFVVIAQRMTADRNDDRDFFKVLQDAIDTMPERERERIRRVSLLEDSRLDVTHPPMSNRVALIKARGSQQAEVMMSNQQFDQIQNELAPARTKIQKDLLQRY
ncbi:MAG: M48 family metallopeptidase [Anaerolineales bacterium]|nr:M48 family metallopeptidase [Anaerolineales bacterium]